MKNNDAGRRASGKIGQCQDMLLEVIADIFEVSRNEVEDSPAARKAFVVAVNDLKGREVMAIVLRAIGMSYRAAGRAMGVSGQQVRTNEARGFRKLRRSGRLGCVEKYVYRKLLPKPPHNLSPVALTSMSTPPGDWEAYKNAVTSCRR
ncbi:MAG TPA: hypothetical protein VN625_01655 [Desulfuromonadaceae bacterium]|nr:hypothetical protein [Desulfuromonadaceae bacterium]